MCGSIWWPIGIVGGWLVACGIIGAYVADRHDRNAARLWNGVRWR